MNAWSRSLYQSLPLQQLYYFVIFGQLSQSLPPLDSQRYRAKGVPEGIQLEFASYEESPDLWDQFLSGPAWDDFLASSPEAGQQILHSASCVVIHGQIPDASSLEPLGDVIGLVACLLDNGGVAVFDILTATWFPLVDWQTGVFDQEVAGLARLVSIEHYTTQGTDQDANRESPQNEPSGAEWLFTRGMRRFARPDISFPDVRLDQIDAAQQIIEFLSQKMIDGAAIPDGTQFNFPEKEMKIRCNLLGGLEDPHFFNFYIQLAIV